MIIAVTGMPGSGKSVYLTYSALKGLKEGRNVFSNTFIKGTFKITFQDICTKSFPHNSLIILDEAGRWFNSRAWKDLPTDVFDLFTMHRHMEIDLLVGVQNFNRIDKSLREVIELVYWANNKAWLPFFYYDGFYDLEKSGSKMKEHDLRKIVWKTKKVFRAYDTHGMATEFDDKPEVEKLFWEYEETGPETVVGKVKEYIKRKREKETIDFDTWD